MSIVYDSVDIVWRGVTSKSRRKENMRRGIRTRISQLMYRCLAQYPVNSALCVDIQLWSRHVASRPPEIPTERSGYSIGTVCGLAPQPEAVSTPSIHLFICSSVHSLTPYLLQLDYTPTIEVWIHFYSTQSPVKRAYHAVVRRLAHPADCERPDYTIRH